MSDSPIRVLVTDDEVLLAQSIWHYLELKGFDVVGMAHDGHEAVHKTLVFQPDVVLLDLTMPQMSGMEALPRIKQARPQTSVLILTAHAKPGYLATAILNGASAYLTKSESGLVRLPAVIQAIHQCEEAIIEPSLLYRAFQMASDRLPEGIDAAGAADILDSLTQQETRVLELLAQGMSNPEIADALVVSGNTIKSHVQRVLRKLGVSDRTQAALLALRSGMGTG